MVASVSFKEGAHQVVRNIDIPNNKFSDFKLGINEEVKKICLDMDGNELLIHGKKADNRNFIVKTKLNI